MTINLSEGIEPGNLSIKVLTTNTTSITLATEGKFAGKVIQPQMKANRTLAEHGLALSIKISENGESHHFLLDTGGMKESIIDNCETLREDLSDVEKVVLSHGHMDHFGGLKAVIPKIKDRAEILLHPTSFAQTQVILTKSGEEFPVEVLQTDLRKLEKEGKIAGKAKLPTMNKNEIVELANQNNVKLIETNKPEILYKGIATSGEIELFDEAELSRGMYIIKGKKELEKHTFRDEISIYINVKDKGLVVLTGCAHTGLLNTIKHGQKLTGIDKIYAIIGGFHKEYETPENIESTVKYIEQLNPDVTCGMHCTGFNFNRIMVRHPSHTLATVGTEFIL